MNIQGESTVTKFCQAMAVTAWELLKTNNFKDGKNHPIIRRLAARFVGYFVEFIVKETLMHKTILKFTKNQQYEFATQNFRELKKDLEQEIAFGMARAMSEMGGSEIEYYCQIKLVPEVKTKYEC